MKYEVAGHRLGQSKEECRRWWSQENKAEVTDKREEGGRVRRARRVSGKERRQRSAGYQSASEDKW